MPSTARLAWVLACGFDAVHAMSFTDVSSDSGFQPGHSAGLPAGGIAVADFDGNGFPDIFVTGYAQPNRLYFNQGDGTFTEDIDINDDLAGSDCTVTAAADYDNDGWPDLYVGCHHASNHLFRNVQGQAFQDVTTAVLDHNPPGPNPARTDAVTWGDINGDGLLDLFVGVYPATTSPDPGVAGNLDRILIQNDDGTWTNVAPGLDTDTLARPALAATMSDLDQDGDTDLYVVNDKDRGNVLWRNDGPGCGGWCFTDIAPASGADRPVNGMGIAIGDIDRDGLWDLYFSDNDEQVMLRGTGLDPLTFVEHQNIAGVNLDAIGWATIFADFDNDAFEDAFLAVSHGPPGTSRFDRWYRNQGDTTFEDVSMPLDLDWPTQAAAYIDYDRDGRMDLVVGHWSEGYRLYRNNTSDPGNWLGLELSGGFGVNADAVGALVILETPNGVMRRRELRAGESRGASHDKGVHFGLDDRTSAQIVIAWPDGYEQDLGTFASGQYHSATHPVVFRDHFD